MERTGWHDSTILTADRGGIVAEQYNMQNYGIVERIEVVPMRIPIAGTAMKLDGPYMAIFEEEPTRTGCWENMTEDRIADIWSLRSTGITSKEHLIEIPIAQWQQAAERKAPPAAGDLFF